MRDGVAKDVGKKEESPVDFLQNYVSTDLKKCKKARRA